MLTKITKSLIICLLTMVIPGLNLTPAISAAPPMRVQAVKEANPMPKFPGGQEAFEKYINEHFTFPTDELKRKDYVDAKITIRLVVMSDGKIGPYTIFKPDSKPFLQLGQIDNILKEMPKFTPGKVKGKPVNVNMTFSVTLNPPVAE